MDRYEVMAGKMAPLTDGAHRKWGFTGKVETRSYERLVDALIDFVETGDSLKARFLTGFAACLAADRKSVENRGFGVAVRKVQCHRGEDGSVLSGPDIISRGFVYMKDNEDLMDAMKMIATHSLEVCHNRNISDWATIKSTIKGDLSQFLFKNTKRNPMILPVIMEI